MDERGASNRLMIVDDDPATRRALGSIFSRGGWVVRTAATVAEAMDLLDHGRVPDFLILDLILPDGGGEAVLRRVRETRLPSHVIVCTGDSDPIRRRAVRDLEPDLVVTKPIGPDVLRNLCGNWARLA